MDYIALIGYLAAFFTTAAYIPQTVKVIRTKSTRDISLGMFICINIGIFLWAVYGILLGSYPIIIANVATLVMSMVILCYKIKYR
ncbi:MAG: SemiSWEET transporter [Candidatus Gastranaerophilales bacterium]|nr:SemiSWEET transporter [Candidatus Gastranaerophilales bacterium]